MPHVIVVVALILLSPVWLPSLGYAQSTSSNIPTEDQIRLAIIEGAMAKHLPLAELRPGGGFATMGTRGRTIAVYSTPLTRVRLAAYSATKTYQPFTREQVTQEMLAPELHVHAAPVAIPGEPAVANVLTVVILPHGSKDRSKATQPVRTMEMLNTFKNLMGFTAEGRGVTAVFPLDLMTRDYDLHVVYDRKVPTGRGNSGSNWCDDCAVRFYAK